MKWYKYDIRDLSDTEYIKWYSLMSKENQNRVERFRFIDDKKRTVAGEMLARIAISAWCNVSPESIVFNKSKNGKPFAEGLDVEFNISHSHDMVVCAVSDKPIGIDIEKIRPINLNVAKRICTKDELVYLFGHEPNDADFNQKPDNTTLTRFFEIWTAKEAYVKCIGTGIGDIKHDTGKSKNDIYCFDNYVICVSPSKKASS